VALSYEIRLKGEAERRADAETLLSAPGDTAIIRRGVVRSLLLRCPDGCGQTLLVNLDPRAGKAWRLRIDRGGLTLYPSVWREGGCGSHFVIWQHRILWCDRSDATEGEEPEYDDRVEDRVAKGLRRELAPADEIGERVYESGWEVARACRRLVAAGRARCGEDEQKDWFGLPESAGRERVPPPKPGIVRRWWRRRSSLG